VVEPSGAVGAAAVLNGRIPGPSGRIGVILSGGNMDPETLAGILKLA
jgi:threo-3-hydroxy-L-aspartate ammonia-lyase